MRKKIPVREFLEDIRSGMSDHQLMKKYRISPKGLRSAYNKMLHAKIITEKQFYEFLHASSSPSEESSLRQDSVIVEDERQLARLRPPGPVFIYGNQPGIKGQITDITEHGVGIRGINAVVGGHHGFVIMPEPYLPIEPIMFTAECRWVKKNANGELIGGFRITEIPEPCLQALRTLIRLLSLAGD